MDAVWQAEQRIRIDRLQRLAPMGTRWKKKSGSEWQGRIVGYYTTKLTGEGVAVESEVHEGSVQIYPLKALERI